MVDKPVIDDAQLLEIDESAVDDFLKWFIAGCEPEWVKAPTEPVEGGAGPRVTSTTIGGR